MKNDNFDTDGIDDEIVKSVEKLIDEETSVAKAYYDRNALGTEQGADLEYEDILNEDISTTRTIPDVRNRQYSETAGNAASAGKALQDDRNHIKWNLKKKRQQQMVTAAIAICIAVVLLVLGVVLWVMNINKKNSFSYNYSAGLSHYNSKAYAEALQYWEKAAQDAQGRRNAALKIKMAECYKALGQTDKTVEMLQDALSYDKYNETALKMLATQYIDDSDGAALTELLRKYKSTDGEKHLKSYEVAAPTASEPAGTYDKLVKLELKAQSGYKIYYTTDGSAVTTASRLYTEPIVLEKGRTTVKTAAVNSIGTMSNELELVYDVNYSNPEAPSITPVTGSYPAGTMIEITNIPQNGKAYYTLNGKVPTKASTEYHEPIEMPSGNTVFSAIIIDENGLESTVTKRNYDVDVVTKYSYDEALDRLKVVMIAKGDMNRDGTSADGGEANFTYYKKTSIANVEMFIVFYDIIKAGVSTRQNYYFGIDTETGKTYKVFEQNGTLIASEY